MSDIKPEDMLAMLRAWRPPDAPVEAEHDLAAPAGSAMSGTCASGFHEPCGGRLPGGRWCECHCHDGKRWYVRGMNKVYDDEAVAWEFCAANESPEPWSPNETGQARR